MRRKNHTDATDASATARKGWGPFSGAQLTVIIVAGIVMVLLPVGAFAVVSGSNSFITDATSGTHAAVNPAGQLSAALAPPAKTFTTDVYENHFSDSEVATLLVPAGTASIVSSLDIQTSEVEVGTDPASHNVVLFLWTTSGTSCKIVDALAVGLGDSTWFVTGNVESTFPAGLAIRVGHRLCAGVNAGTGGFVNVDYVMNGYVVPAGACTPAGSTCR